MKNTPPEDLSSFESLLQIMKTLRSDSGCPWDRKQTHESLTKHTIEETYELIDAIENKDQENLIEELGDVLLQVVFHSEIARNEERFQIQDVLKKLNTKLVSRHPHVFSDTQAGNAEEALESWNQAKSLEKKSPQKGFGIPSHLPALQYAQKIGDKTKKFHFDWESPQEVFQHVESELQEFKDAMASSLDHMEDEFGDLLFTLVQTARHLKIDAEKALRRTNKKVEGRWDRMKLLATQKAMDFSSLSTEELNALWTEVKKDEKK